MKTRENELHEPMIIIRDGTIVKGKICTIYCNVCGAHLNESYLYGEIEKYCPNYCPNCGARLKEVDE